MKRMKPEERCVVQVDSERTGVYQCGVLTHDGKLYCGPPNVAEKHAKRDKRWKRERELDSLRYAIKDARAAIVDRACELIATYVGARELRAAVEELNRLETKLAKLKAQP